MCCNASNLFIKCLTKCDITYAKLLLFLTNLKNIHLSIFHSWRWDYLILSHRFVVMIKVLFHSSLSSQVQLSLQFRILNLSFDILISILSCKSLAHDGNKSLLREYFKMTAVLSLKTIYVNIEPPPSIPPSGTIQCAPDHWYTASTRVYKYTKIKLLHRGFMNTWKWKT